VEPAPVHRPAAAAQGNMPGSKATGGAADVEAKRKEIMKMYKRLDGQGLSKR